MISWNARSDNRFDSRNSASFCTSVDPGLKKVVLKGFLDEEQYSLSGQLWGENARYRSDRINFTLRNGIPNQQLTLNITKEYNLLVIMHPISNVDQDKLELSFSFFGNEGASFIGNVRWNPHEKATYELFSTKTGEGELQVKCVTDNKYTFSKFIYIPSSGYETVDQAW